jgi:simple sugar transport system permease protein
VPLHDGIVLALAAVAAAAFWLARTESGFRLRVVGASPRAARWAGVPVERSVWTAAAVSGGIAAVGGAVEVLGGLGRLFDSVSPGYGFTGIAVALLARLHPAALVPAAFFFGALEAGSSRLQQDAGVSHVLVLVIQAVVILASAASVAGRGAPRDAGGGSPDGGAAGAPDGAAAIANAPEAA